ncbi:tRNA nucleotidyltransferase (plasmid) [Euzebya pacifica]|uniref:tRNA nucleotidyltransferase n=1 Tax=Euzebya pacifica TaxID=1608957 RepID=A0A346Y6R8_9ACTN|nr:tRNA nucleotidyltransferase [Euzebya pacifica]
MHDIGKPDTGRFDGTDVTFRHHEQVGEQIVRDLLPAMGCTDPVLTDRVARTVGLSGRYKADGPGAAEVWSDSAVRRFVRDCGGLEGQGSVLDLVLDLAFADCTSRHPHKVWANESQVQSLTDRIGLLADGDARAAERADLDGQAVMDLLGIGPGPQVGRALAALLAAKRANGGPLPDPEAWLTGWWADTAAAA